MHALIEWNLRQQLGQRVGPEPRVVDDAQWAFMAFQDWATSVQLKPLLIEQIVFSTTHGYAGTMDLLAEVKGVPMLIDFKTGKAIYAESALQSVAYQVALAEMGHTPAQGGLIVRLPKVQTDPAFEVGVVPPAAALFPMFSGGAAADVPRGEAGLDLVVRRGVQVPGAARGAERVTAAGPPRVAWGLPAGVR